MFSGSIPALATPFRDGRFDEVAYRALIDWQVEAGSSALVPCGTTGEAATMTIDEHNHVVSVCVEQAAGRVPVIAGCGSNDSRVALDHVLHAKAAGADAGLLVPPYYNRPNQEGIFAHFEHVVGGSDLPIVLYNVPARTVTDISIATMARLARLPHIVGVKDATGEIDRVSEHRRLIEGEFCLLSGNDDTALAFMATGGDGCISVSANVAPALCAEFQAACRDYDYRRAQELNARLFPLHKALFSDASPGPVKYALSRVREDFSPELRLPMTPPSEASRRLVDEALEIAGLI